MRRTKVPEEGTRGPAVEAAGIPGLYVKGPEMKKQMDDVLKEYLRLGEKYGVKNIKK